MAGRWDAENKGPSPEGGTRARCAEGSEGFRTCAPPRLGRWGSHGPRGGWGLLPMGPSWELPAPQGYTPSHIEHLVIGGCDYRPGPLPGFRIILKAVLLQASARGSSDHPPPPPRNNTEVQLLPLPQALLQNLLIQPGIEEKGYCKTATLNEAGPSTRHK